MHHVGGTPFQLTARCLVGVGARPLHARPCVRTDPACACALLPLTPPLQAPPWTRRSPLSSASASLIWRCACASTRHARSALRSACRPWVHRCPTLGCPATRSTRCCAAWPTLVGARATGRGGCQCDAGRGARVPPALQRCLTGPSHLLAAPAGYGYGGMLGVELPSLQRAKLFMERLQNKHQFGLMVGAGPARSVC